MNKRLQGRALVWSLVIIAGISASGAAQAVDICKDDRPDGLREWERQMVDRGKVWGSYLGPRSEATPKQKLVNEFYDSAHTFYRISDYLQQDEPWTTYAEYALSVYRDGYLVPNNWRAAGWRRSSHGLYENFKRGGDVTLEELEFLRDRPAYSNIREGRDQGGSEQRSRAIALAVQAHVHAERAGSDRGTENGVEQLSVFVPWMGSHLYEWRTGNYQGRYPRNIPRFAPFMFGMTSHALIEYYEWEREQGEDPNRYWPTEWPIDYGQAAVAETPKITWETIPDALADVAMWAVEEAEHETGVPMLQVDRRGEAFLYQSIKKVRPAYDLNLMIAHVYAWLWKETGDVEFREIGDRLFATGARAGSTNSGKHFNQQYRMAFDFIEWRRAGDEKYCAAAKLDAESGD
ncbi:MAG: hypothetical protein QNJ00_15205 [Woeseiaceae bacterium]|nr:hypothetical protein [Woeseiaceae bacterium]